MKYLKKWLIGLEKVTLASSPEEKEAIYRLRYQIYVEELNKKIKTADHVNKTIIDPEDKLPQSKLYYTGPLEQMTGTMRLTLWPKGTITDEIKDLYSLHLFPDIDTFDIMDTGRLVLTKNARGKLVFPAMTRVAYEFACKDNDVYFIFCYCAPGLVKSYRRLGFRPYQASLISTYDGLRAPLVMITSDREYFRAVNSPLTPLVDAHFGKRKKASLNLEPYSEILEQKNSCLQMAPESLWKKLQDELTQKPAVPSFTDSLTESELKKLTDKGFILNVPQNQTVIRRDLQDRELFVILDGVFEVYTDNRRLALLHKGEIFGEVALLCDSGRRTASIRALSSGRVFVLRRKFISELMDKEPKIAAKILYNISRIMADRFAETVKLTCELNSYSDDAACAVDD